MMTTYSCEKLCANIGILCWNLCWNINKSCTVLLFNTHPVHMVFTATFEALKCLSRNLFWASKIMQ